MDFDKTRTEILARQATLKARQVDIVNDRKKLDEEGVKIQWELAGLEQMLEGIDVAISDTPPDFEELGFTDKVRKLLQETKTPLVPTQIRDLLMVQGVTGSSPKNLLILVHGVLKRIKDELIEKERADGKTTYIAKLNSPGIRMTPLSSLVPPIALPSLPNLESMYGFSLPDPNSPPMNVNPHRRRKTMRDRIMEANKETTK
jgi:hypothetical protein